MPTFIFGDNELEHPIFIKFDIGYKNFQIAQSLEVLKDRHKVKILEEFPNAYKQLKKGITVATSEDIQITVRLKRKFIFEKIQVYYNGKELKGHEFIGFKL